MSKNIVTNLSQKTNFQKMNSRLSSNENSLIVEPVDFLWGLRSCPKNVRCFQYYIGYHCQNCQLHTQSVLNSPKLAAKNDESSQSFYGSRILGQEERSIHIFLKGVCARLNATDSIGIGIALASLITATQRAHPTFDC